MSQTASPADVEAANEPCRSLNRQPAPNSFRNTLILAGGCIGIIAGDLGTSELYVMNAIFPSSGSVPSKEDVIGAVSCVIWAITIIPVIKVAIIALCFGTDSNEGGPFALYTALFPPPAETDENRAVTRFPTVDARFTTNKDEDRFIDKKWIRSSLFAWVLFGVTLTMSDGLLTPAVSVTSAVTGISVAVPSVAHSVVPISVAILVVLFLFQAAGTRRVGYTFGPVIFIWLMTNGITGIINVTKYPGILRAFDPSRAVMLFVRTKNYDLLAGVLLAITGVEALFANLGQFSKGSIRLAFIGFVYPCLLLAYLGQGAMFIIDGEKVLSNAFFNSIPGGVGSPFWWFTWIFAVLAAIIASQAMITATFSLIQQLTRLNAIPPLKLIYTDDESEGRIFVPSVNFLLMVGTVALTAAFGTDAALTNAYGFAVSGVLIVTTSFIALSIFYIKKLPLVLAVFFLVVSGFFDGLFWGASLKKVPHGAWFPLGMAAVLCIIFVLYSWAKKLETRFDEEHRLRLTDVMRSAGVNEQDQGYTTAIREKGNEVVQVTTPQVPSYESIDRSTALARLPVFAFFHNPSASTLGGAPHAFSAFLRSYPSLPQVIIFFNVRVVGVPYTTEEERYVVSRVRSFEGLFIATLRVGYRDEINLSAIAQPIRDRIVDLETRSGVPDVARKIALIDHAMAHTVTHILPHFYVSAAQNSRSKVVNYIRTFLIESIYRRVAVNFDEYDQFIFSPNTEVVRIGVAAAL